MWLDEEVGRGREVVDCDADVVHPSESHLFSIVRNQASRRAALR
jgi:hypothetical protein